MGGRAISYALVGALLGMFAQNLQALFLTSQWLRPLWILFQSGVVVLGFWVFWTGGLPQQVRKALHRATNSLSQAGRPSTIWVIGLGWGLIPCGVLQSVYLMAMVTGDPVQGATTMLIFAISSSFSLWIGSIFWMRALFQNELPADGSGSPRFPSSGYGWKNWIRRGGAEQLMYRATGALMASLAVLGIYHTVLDLLNPGATGAQCN
jgi:ABC-type nickel/cobalt efflux system permease component RcnA